MTFKELKVHDCFKFCADVAYLGDKARVYEKITTSMYCAREKDTRYANQPIYIATHGALVSLEGV